MQYNDTLHNDILHNANQNNDIRHNNKLRNDTHHKDITTLSKKTPSIMTFNITINKK